MDSRKEIVHIDLFSGIAGAARAVDKVWPNSKHIFCEIDPYCQELIKLRFPGSYVHGDIKTFKKENIVTNSNRAGYRTSNGQTIKDREEGGKEWEYPQLELGRCGVDLLTGGFPCQPFSAAGRRKGTADDRHLWPEMLRVIREFKPRWVIGENVGGFITWGQGVVLEQVCTDLEGEGYEVQPFIIPAVSVNAPHRRDRVWIVAHSNISEHDREKPGSSTEKVQEEVGVREKNNTTRESSRADESISKDRLIDGHDSTTSTHTISTRTRGEGRKIGDQGGNASKDRGESIRQNNREASPSGVDTTTLYDWNRNWFEVATQLCGMDDGLPAELDRLKLSQAQHRTHRLRGLGNAWVPAVAVQIMQAIKEID